MWESIEQKDASMPCLMRTFFLIGTYNNQYMVLDLKQIELGKSLHDNALWVVEQIPTKVSSGDQTQILRTGESIYCKPT